MNKQKVISALQSRIAKRKNIINSYWRVYKELTESASFLLMKEAKSMAILLGNEQKLDEALLHLLYNARNQKQRYVEIVYDLQKQNQYYRRALASYKLTGQPYEGG